MSDVNSKRKLDNTADHQGVPHRFKLRKILSKAQYTLVWVCALDIERTAAEATLDEVHADLPYDMNDPNNYTLGSIGRCNIVIAYPHSQGSEKVNSTRFIHTFPSIRSALMVGIGGSVPSTDHDIRLGDVVVGTDFTSYNPDNRAHVDGSWSTQDATANKRIDNRVRTAISTLRSSHDFYSSRVHSILSQRTDKLVQYMHPRLPDLLFQAPYVHEVSDASCSNCDSSRIIPRHERKDTTPNIHYGLIASGNQVIKDAIFRDEYASVLGGVLCFEMEIEASGLIDDIPCLRIRGICDYCDTHRYKEWQKYAAAAAAAFAKVLVEAMPVEEGTNNNARPRGSEALPLTYRQKLLLESLVFHHMDTRRLAIRMAHANTCWWLLQHSIYQKWLDYQEVVNHRGYLSINGKSGSGKSIMMNFISIQMKKNDQPDSVSTISFFFNAMGEHLERSEAGMFRSLLFQLLEAFPNIHEVFDDSDITPSVQMGCPLLDVLKHLFYKAVLNLGVRSLTCYIDALDECDERQAFDIVRYFEHLCQSSFEAGVRLKVCTSSQKHSLFDVRVGLRLRLEDQAGHAEDAATYIKSSLHVQESILSNELSDRMIKMFEGNFLWLILVVNTLNEQVRHGELAPLRRILSEVPRDPRVMIKNVVLRGSTNKKEFQLAMLWILCAKRPLHPGEYYYAIWSGAALMSLANGISPETATHTESVADIANQYVISTSRGLATAGNGKKPAVQFIHESVRRFMIYGGGLSDVWPELGTDWEVPAHDFLRQCCVFHLQITARMGFRPENQPFLKYSSENVLYHANKSAILASQINFLANFRVDSWIEAHNATEPFKVRHYNPKASLTYILADRGHDDLIRIWMTGSSSTKEMLEETSDLQQRYQHPLFAALATRNRDTVAALLGSESTTFHDCDIMNSATQTSSEFRGYRNRTPLT